MDTETINKIVKIVSEQVTNQTKAEITNLRTRILQLEARVEAEASRRAQLEDEVAKLKKKGSTLNISSNNEQRKSTDNSSTGSSSPRENEGEHNNQVNSEYSYSPTLSSHNGHHHNNVGEKKKVCLSPYII